MNTDLCLACGFTLDTSDNFCRRCGTAAVEPTLPALRRDATPTVWQPQLSPVVKGAAVMAAGTVGQFLFRRAVSSMLGTGGRRSQPRSVHVGNNRGQRDGMVDEAQVITETIMMRRVRIRRQA
jgi:hypothetical protein